MRRLLYILPLFIVNLTIAQIPENGLVGYWPFNGDANDESSYNNNGTIYGSELVLDRNGNTSSAYGFDGLSEYINMGDVDCLDGSTSLSISAWIFTSGNTDPNTGTIVSKYNAIGNANRVFLLDVLSGNNLRFNVYGSDGDADYERCITNAPIPLSQWINFVVTWDGTTHKIDIFINGEEVSSNYSYNGNKSDQIYNKNSLLHIGAANAGSTTPDYFFNGSIDEVRIYNRVISQQEIEAIFNEISSSDTWQTNSNDIFYYNGEGNVGIGTNTPAAKLTVDGPILSTEVKVKTDISTYPDFVFKPEYKIRTIEETEKYIIENGHLPEIPEASEVEEGISLGRMNVMLLQKIEELTLYMIELNKEVKNLNYENENLKVQNENQNIKILELEEKLNTKK